MQFTVILAFTSEQVNKLTIIQDYKLTSLQTAKVYKLTIIQDYKLTSICLIGFASCSSPSQGLSVERCKKKTDDEIECFQKVESDRISSGIGSTDRRISGSRTLRANCKKNNRLLDLHWFGSRVVLEERLIKNRLINCI